MRDLAIVMTILAVLLTGCQSSEKAKTTTNSSSQIPLGANQIPYEDVPGLVKVQVLGANDELMGEGDFYNGLHHGTWTDYLIGGQISKITSYWEGKKHGPEILFSRNGMLSTVTYYHNDKLHGKTTTYNGSRIKEEKEYVNGVLDGMVRMYYDDGTLLEASPYKNGKRDGIARWYNAQGEKTIEYLYKNGTQVKDYVPDSTIDNN